MVTVTELDELSKEIFTQKEVVEECEAAREEASKKLYALQNKLLGIMQDLDKEKYFVTGLGTISRQKRFTVKTPKTEEDKKAFLAYLETKGIFWDLVTVNSNTLNSFYKQEFDIAREEKNLNFKIPGIGEPTYSEFIKLKKE